MYKYYFDMILINIYNNFVKIKFIFQVIKKIEYEIIRINVIKKLIWKC